MFACGANLFMMATSSCSSSNSSSQEDVHGDDSHSGNSQNSSLIGSPPSSPSNKHVTRHHQHQQQQSGPRYKLVHEGDIQMCRLNHTRTIVSKIMNSKYLRRWESHRLILGQTEITSLTVSTQQKRKKEGVSGGC